MYIYALTYANPHEDGKPFVLFLTSSRLLAEPDALAAAVDAVSADNLGHEWVDAVSHGTLCGPLVVDGRLSHPSIAVEVD